ncbi:hypothetical protein JCGZ_07796 [Jatropha curcas]|uniref:Uncharacterized protein n=1 Tax=Jatropha curcas TaxID=180498 RepID=A0A067KPN7_JATCU|nr:hypothetical protein JCGZ_07796 [Jatropha curcas]
MAMSLKKWRNSSYRETIQLGRSNSVQVQVGNQKNIIEEARKPKWHFLKFWRKIYNRQDQKKEVFNAASYDPEEYYQNFDHGNGWAEPDNLPRSFSARFADPSRLVVSLKKNSSVRCVRGV